MNFKTLATIPTLALILILATVTVSAWTYTWMPDFDPTGSYFAVEDDIFCYSTNATHAKCVDNEGTTIKTIGSWNQTLLPGFQAVGSPIGVMQTGVNQWNNTHVFVTAMRHNSTVGTYRIVQYDYDTNTFKVIYSAPSHWERVNVVAYLDDHLIISRSNNAYTPFTHIVKVSDGSYKNTTSYFSSNGPSLAPNCYNSGTYHPIYYSSVSFVGMSEANSGAAGVCPGKRLYNPGYYVLAGDTLLSKGCAPTQVLPGMPSINCTYDPVVASVGDLPNYANIIRDTGASEALLTKPRLVELFTTPGWYGFQNSINTTDANVNAYNIPVLNLEDDASSTLVTDWAGTTNAHDVLYIYDNYIIEEIYTGANTRNLTFRIDRSGTTYTLDNDEEPSITPDYTAGTNPAEGSLYAFGDTLVIVGESGLLYLANTNLSSILDDYDVRAFSNHDLITPATIGLFGHPCDALYYDGTSTFLVQSYTCNPFNASSGWDIAGTTQYQNDLDTAAHYAESRLAYKHINEGVAYQSLYPTATLVLTVNDTTAPVYMAVDCDAEQLSNNVLYTIDMSDETETTLNSACNITERSDSTGSCGDVQSDEFLLFNTTACITDLSRTTGVLKTSYSVMTEFYLNTGSELTLEQKNNLGAVGIAFNFKNYEDVGGSGEDRYVITINGDEVYNVTQESWPSGPMSESDNVFLHVTYSVTGTTMTYSIDSKASDACTDTALVVSGTKTLAGSTMPYRFTTTLGTVSGPNPYTGLGDIVVLEGGIYPSYTTDAPSLLYTSPVSGRKYYGIECSLASSAAEDRYQTVRVYHTQTPGSYSTYQDYQLAYSVELADKLISQAISGSSGTAQDAANSQSASTFFCSALKVCSPGEKMLFAVFIIVLFTVVVAAMVYSNYQSTFAAHSVTVGVFVLLFTTFAALKFLPTWFVVVFGIMSAGGIAALVRMNNGGG